MDCFFLANKYIMLFSQIMSFDVCNITKTSVTTWQFKCQTMGSMVFQKHSLWLSVAHHLNIWEVFRFTFDVACSPRTQEITRPRTVKFQWQSLHHTILLLYKISVRRSALSVMDRNTNQTIIEARLNSWQRRWQRVLQHLSATNWLKTFVGIMQHHMNLVAC